MKKFTSDTQKRGELGEDIACRFLVERGFSILERNYTKKWGEIDIIAEKAGVTHFVEVKSVARETGQDEEDVIRPEDHMHRAKIERLSKTLETYFAGREVRLWQFDLMCVYIDEKAKKARVKVLDDIILG